MCKRAYFGGCVNKLMKIYVYAGVKLYDCVCVHWCARTFLWAGSDGGGGGGGGGGVLSSAAAAAGSARIFPVPVWRALGCACTSDGRRLPSLTASLR